MRIAAFTKYGRLAASTRQRLLQYVPHLEAAGISVEYHPLLEEDYVAKLVTGTPIAKVDLVRSYASRMKQLGRTRDCDLIWVYAELFPYLPAPFERLAFASGKPVVYDFDDAFFHQYDDHSHRLVRAVLAGKLEPLLAGAAACCCGNAYLQDYARRYCEQTVHLPTVVDTDIYRPSARHRPAGEPAVIGWIGSPSTWKFLLPLLPLLRDLVRNHNVEVRIVGAGAKAEQHATPGITFVEWREESEVADVQRMDIGVMPLSDEVWSRGKSGYKLVQYMACGLPAVASPVGVNRELIADGRTGFLATTAAEWSEALTRLIRDPDLRRSMGKAGREIAEDRYSLAVHAPRLVALLKTVAAGTGSRPAALSGRPA